MLQRVPFLLPLVALLCAVGLSALGFGWILAVALIVAAILVSFAFGRHRDVRTLILNSRWRVLWVFLLLLGVCLGILSYHDFMRPDENSDHRIVEGFIEETTPVENGDRLLVSVSDFPNGHGFTASTFRLLVYTGASDFAPGETVSFPADIQWIDDDPLPSRSYESIMNHRGVLGRAFIDKELIRTVDGRASMLSPAISFREYFSGLLSASQLDHDTRMMLSMLLAGDKSDCSRVVRNRFALSGMAHIFALSGMHLWIIAGLFLWLLQPLNLFLPSKVRFIAVIPVVWIFCFLIGLPWSTVRAAIMFSLLMLAKVLERENVAANALCAAAFIIIAFTPSALADAGFQLSFFAMLCLLAYSDALYAIDQKSNPALYRITSFLLACVVGTAGTWAIAAYHFGFFSPGFAISNILLVPFLPLYMLLGIGYVLGLAFDVRLTVVSDLLEAASHAAIGLSEWLAGAGEAVVHVSPHPVAIVLWISGVVLLGWYFRARRNFAADKDKGMARGSRRWMLAAASLCIVAALLLLPVTSSAEYVPSRMIFGRTPVGCMLSITEPDFSRQYLDTDEPGTRILDFHGQKIIVVNENRYSPRSRHPFPVPARPVDCDYLIVANGYRGNLPELLRFFRPAVVLEGRRESNIGIDLSRHAAECGVRVVELRPDARFSLELYPRERQR